MEEALNQFQNGNTKAAISLYSEIIENQQERWIDALLNRGSAYYIQCHYEQSRSDSKKYLTQVQQAKVQGYVLLANSIIKLKSLVTSQEKEVLELGKQRFSYHKKLLDSLKIIQQLQVAHNQDQYLDKIFQKLLSQPKLRNIMHEEAFLTKIEKLIKNPSLACTLIKMDPRLADVQQIILMAQQ